MMTAIRSRSGMTLVEALVSSLVAVVIGFVIYTVSFVYTNESGNSVSRFFMQQQYDNVSSQIAHDVHRASFIGADAETPLMHGVSLDTTFSIRLFDNAGQPFARYSIVNGLLYEGLAQTPYNAGGSQVRVVEGTSCFIVTPNRRTLTLQLAICRNERTNTHVLALRKDMFVCRN